METEPSELDFSSAKTWIFFYLPFLSLQMPFHSTSKPQKPMNKSNPKQKIKPTLQRVLLLHWSGDEKPCVRSDFHRLSLVIGEKPPRFGNWHLGFCIVASFFHWSGGEKPHGCWVAFFFYWVFARLLGFYIVASLLLAGFGNRCLVLFASFFLFIAF